MLRTDSNLVIKHVGSDIFGENSRNKILCLTIDSPERAYFVSGDKYFPKPQSSHRPRYQ